MDTPKREDSGINGKASVMLQSTKNHLGVELIELG
jgi:hypothetical protein